MVKFVLVSLFESLLPRQKKKKAHRIRALSAVSSIYNGAQYRVESDGIER